MSVALRELDMVAWSRFIHDSPMHTPRGEGFNQRWGQGLEDDALGNLIGNGHGLHPAERLRTGESPVFLRHGRCLEANGSADPAMEGRTGHIAAGLVGNRATGGESG